MTISISLNVIYLHLLTRNRPQMIKLTRLVSDFLLPKIRDSFMRQFAAVSALEEVEEEAVSEILAAATTMASISAGAAMLPCGSGMGVAAVSVGSRTQAQGSQKGITVPPVNSNVAETVAAISCAQDIHRQVHGLHGEEKVRAIVYLLKLATISLNINALISFESRETAGCGYLLKRNNCTLELGA